MNYEAILQVKKVQTKYGKVSKEEKSLREEKIQGGLKVPHLETVVESPWRFKSWVMAAPSH